MSAVARGHANLGYCAACDRQTLFVETGPWLRDQYLCVRCQAIPRWRALMETVNEQAPQWRVLAVFEAAPGGPASARLARECASYVSSHYSGADDGSGENLEHLTFGDDTFDLVITQDVLEHVLRPDLALREITRVLRPGGKHIFTVPIYKGRATRVRAQTDANGEIELLAPADYHGDPVSPLGALVVREWGDDFVDFVGAHTGLTTTVYEFNDRSRGLDGEFLQVFVTY